MAKSVASMSSGPRDFQIAVQTSSARAHVAVHGELDLAHHVELNAVLEKLALENLAHVLLDLRGVTFMDSSGLRTVLAADSRAKDGGHAFAVVRGPRALQRVFVLTGMNEKLVMVDDPAEFGEAG